MSLPNANFSRYKNRDVVWGRTLTSRCTSFTSGNNIAQRGHRQHLSYFQQQQQQQQNGPYVTVRYVNLPAQLFGCLQAEHLDPREHSSYATNATTGLKKKRVSWPLVRPAKMFVLGDLGSARSPGPLALREEKHSGVCSIRAIIVSRLPALAQVPLTGAQNEARRPPSPSSRQVGRPFWPAPLYKRAYFLIILGSARFPREGDRLFLWSPKRMWSRVGARLCCDCCLLELIELTLASIIGDVKTNDTPNVKCSMNHV